MKAYLKITTWAETVEGASHYFGRLQIERYKDDVIVERPLSASDAKRINVEEARAGGPFRRLEAGEESGRFFSEQAVVDAAITIIYRDYPQVILLLKGERGILDPQPVLIGPEPLKAALNLLVAEAEANDWWEGDEPTMEDIYTRWRAAIDQLWRVETVEHDNEPDEFVVVGPSGIDSTTWQEATAYARAAELNKGLSCK